MTCASKRPSVKAISSRMNKLGQHVFHAFAAGSVEELAAALEVITLVSIHPKTRRADQDFPRQVGAGDGN
jgi:RsiW-degrading membrane proteinase PrsW (M82 family)